MLKTGLHHQQQPFPGLGEKLPGKLAAKPNLWASWRKSLRLGIIAGLSND